eukprot:6954802-Pyramimonas_sp.AAC.1
MEWIRGLAQQLDGQRAAWVARLHPRVRRVIGHLHLPLLNRLLQEIHYEEEMDCMDTLTKGRPMLGEGLLTTGLYPPQASRATTTVTQWARSPRARNLDMIRG